MTRGGRVAVPADLAPCEVAGVDTSQGERRNLVPGQHASAVVDTCHREQAPAGSTGWLPEQCRLDVPCRGWVAFDRITVAPDLVGGVPMLRGLRIPVATVVSMVADGLSVAEVLDDLPDLERDEVLEALRFAAESLRERQVPLLRPASGCWSTTSRCA